MRWLGLLVMLAACDRLLQLQEIEDTGPPLPPGPWQTVATGDVHSCALKLDGTLWCWGKNDSGQSGLGSAVVETTTPVRVGEATWSAISARVVTTCGIQTDGSLWCWGSNNYGQLGDGTMMPRYEPTHVGDGYVAVAVGESHTCAIADSGSLSCWGQNADGELARPMDAGSTTPVVVPSTHGWTQVTAGQNFTCAIADDASAWCWGLNGDGELGAGLEYGTSSTPMLVSHDAWSQLAAGRTHACGLLADGRIRCWGSNVFGQLGDGGSDGALSPVALATDESDWIAVATGEFHTCATKSDGSLSCWGDNTYGELGNTTTSRYNAAPVLVAHAAKTWAQVAGGLKTTCGVGTDHNLWCFGVSALGGAVSAPEPSQVAGHWRSVAAGVVSTCGITSDGSLACWGDNGQGQIGDNTYLRRTSPTIIAGPSWTAVRVATSDACALRADGSLWCWGNFYVGFGDGTIDRIGPDPIPGGPWTEIAIGDTHICALDQASTLWCWGDGFNGALATGTSMQYLSPHQSSTMSFSALACGLGHTCALSAGEVYCSGLGFWGQVGNGTTNVANLVLAGVFTGNELFTGHYSTCALDGARALTCWGDDRDGQLAISSLTLVDVPTLSDSGPWLTVGLGENHSCGIKMDGSLWCWGDDSRGELGDRSTTNQLVPERIGSETDWTQVSAGDNYTCAIKKDQTLWCWGDASFGQLGTGLGELGTPVLVL